MNEINTTLRDKLSSLKREHWVLIGLGVLVLFLISDGGSGATSEVDIEQLDSEIQRKEVCNILIPQVIDMARSEQDVEIIELNRVAPSTVTTSEKPLTCFADAITSMGEASVTYGLLKTPQDQVLVTLDLDQR